MKILRLESEVSNRHSNLLDSLSDKEKKAYRERVRYWSKERGLTLEEAQQKAIERLLAEENVPSRPADSQKLNSSFGWTQAEIKYPTLTLVTKEEIEEPISIKKAVVVMATAFFYDGVIL